MKKAVVGITIFISLCTKTIAGTVEVVTVDIIKQDNYIFICDAETRCLIFELNKNKKADYPDYIVFDELLQEAAGRGEKDGAKTYRKYTDLPELN